MRRVVLTVVLSITAFAGVGGAQAKRAIELADYYRLEAVSDPQISPDGTQVAFVRSVIIEATNTRQSEISDCKDGRLGPADQAYSAKLQRLHASLESRWDSPGFFLSPECPRR